MDDGSKNYEEILDKEVTVLIKDGKYVSGILRSFDQFYNITIEDGTERIFLDKEYSEKNVGLYVIRGENIVLISNNQLGFENYKKTSLTTIQRKLDELKLINQ